jgi:serine/threonine protein kinase
MDVPLICGELAASLAKCSFDTPFSQARATLIKWLESCRCAGLLMKARCQDTLACQMRRTYSSVMPTAMSSGSSPGQSLQSLTVMTSSPNNVSPYRFSDELADLLDKLLILDPETRLTADAALDHEWFWTDPLPATPGSVKVFPSSHEYDKRKAQEERSHHGSDKNRAAQEAAFRGPNSVVKMPGQVQMPAQQQQIQQQPQPAMQVPYMSQPFNARAVQPQYQAPVPQQQQWPAALPGRPVGSFPTAAASLPRMPNQGVPSMPYAQPVYSNPPPNHPLPYGQPQQRPFQPTYQPPIASSSTLPPLPPSLPAKPGGMRFNQMVSSASAASRMKSSASAGDVDPYRRRNSPPRKIAGTSAASDRSGRPP